MVDSTFDNIPLDRDLKSQYLSICLDVYCPGQSVFLREEVPLHGFLVIEQMIRKVVED